MNAAVGERARALRQWWSGVALLFAFGIFAQAVFAGLMLSGDAWARAAHMANAGALTGGAFIAGLAAIVTLRRVPRGLRTALTFAGLGVALALQTAVGKMSVAGGNLMWVHVPLGVALVGLAAHALGHARRLGEA